MKEMTTPAQMTQQDYDAKVSEMAQANHIWVNAFDCVRPTPEFCERLGRNIINMLRSDDRLMPSSTITSDNDTMRELAELTPMLYLSINKS